MMKKRRGSGTTNALSGKGQLQTGQAAGAPKSTEPKFCEALGLWEATFDAITDLVSIIDRDFRIIKVNKAFAQALKKAPQELLGHKCYETIHGSTEPSKSCPHNQALQSGKSVAEEFWEPHLEKYVQVSVSPLLNLKNEMIGSVHIIKDITNRKNAEDTLRQSEERFRLTFDQSPIGAALLDAKDGHFARTNGAFCRFTGYSKEELAQLTFRDLTHPDDLALSVEQTRLLFAGEIDRFEMEKRYVRKDGSTAWGHLFVQVVTDRSGRILYTLATIQDISERKRAEEALRESEESYRSLVETSPDAIFLHEEGMLVYLNPAAVRLYGADSAEELYGKNAFDIVHPDDREAILNRTDFIMVTGAPVPLKEIRTMRRDGSTVDVEATAGISRYRGKKVVQVIQREITERKRAEEKIRASLREKEVLLKEIHHRVKNNLQIISSLLYLQSARTEHAGAVSALRESRNRIKSMALVHERLYSSPDLASVDMGKYTRNLVSDLRQSHMAEDGLIRLRLDIEDIPLGITEAIPCGLIINELVSNALKHAFPKGRQGEITIQLRRVGASQIRLTVADNGIGFPEDVDFRKSPSLGLTLINSLVEQLDGTIQLDREHGTAFTITFGKALYYT